MATVTENIQARKKAVLKGILENLKGHEIKCFVKDNRDDEYYQSTDIRVDEDGDFIIEIF